MLNESPAPNAILMHSDFLYLSPGNSLIFPVVHSRMLVRCVRGEGLFLVNGEKHDLNRGLVIFAPWKAEIRIQVSPQSSLMLHRCQIVPDYQNPSGPPDFQVAVNDEEATRTPDIRQDVCIPVLEGTPSGYLPRNHPIRHLTNYAALWFIHGERSEWQARCIGQQLLSELAHCFSGESIWNTSSPFFQQATDYLEDHMDQQVTTRDLARHLGCSISTVTRHFRQELQETPTEWIHRTKIQEACRLLTSKYLRVGEIAEMVGINDPYYFSKLFRRYQNQSPSEYRSLNGVT